MSIVTKKGDRGKTRLCSGEEVSKSSDRLEAFGTLDELISFLGFARSLCRINEVAEQIRQEQKRLIRLCTELATKEESKVKLDPISAKDVEAIEKFISDCESKIALPKEFIIPGKNRSSAALDVSRTICRRFERLSVKLTETGEWDNKDGLAYINRLSDLIFLMARMEEG